MRDARDVSPAPLPPTADCLGVPRNAAKATVFVIRRAAGDVVRKQLDLALRGPIAAVGRWALSREKRMLRVLESTGLVPRILAEGRGWYESEFVPGETVASRRSRGISPDEGRRIERALAAFHASGYAHGDIGRRDIILRPDGGVTFLDVATAIGPGHPPILWPVLRAVARRHDRTRVRWVVKRAQKRREDCTDAEAEIARRKGDG